MFGQPRKFTKLAWFAIAFSLVLPALEAGMCYGIDYAMKHPGPVTFAAPMQTHQSITGHSS